MLGISSILSLMCVGCNSTQEVKTIIEANPHEVLANKEARQAMHLALNKEKLNSIHEYYPISDGLLNRGIYINENGIDYRDFADSVSFVNDIEAAQKKWKKVKEDMNFTNVTIELKLPTISEDDKYDELYDEIEKQLEQLEGLDIQIKTVLASEYQLDSDSQLVVIDIDTLVPIAEGTLGGFRGDIGTMSVFEYKNDTLIELLDKAHTSTTLDEKWKYCFDAERNIVEEAIVYPIHQSKRERIKKKYVEGNELFTTGVYASYRNVNLKNGSKTIRIGRIFQEPVEADLTKSSFNSGYDMVYETMDGLVRLNKNNEIEKVLAESWEITEDAKKWTFKLVKDAKWHNGEPVVADDFVYGIQRMLNPEIKAKPASLMFDIKGAYKYYTGEEKDVSKIGVKALDDYTLEFEFENPNPECLKLLSTPVFYPQNKKFIEKCGEKYGTSPETTLFNGPFKLEKIDESFQNYTLVKHEGYRNAKDIKIDKMIIENNETLEISLEKFKNNELDVIMNGLSDDYTEYINSEEFKNECVIDKAMTSRFTLLVFNPTYKNKEENLEIKVNE